MRTIGYFSACRAIISGVFACGIAIMSGCDMAGNMTTDQTSALGALTQNLVGFFFDFARQLIAAFIF